MACVSPISVNLNGLGHTTVSCGKCYECLRQKRNEWSFRLYQEQKVSNSAVFVTLTYKPEKIPIKITKDGEMEESLFKEDYQNFIKAVRYENKKYTPIQVRYYGVGEYGSKTERPHYHLILFNCDVKTLNKIPEIWKKGRVHIGNASSAAIRYVTKYLINKKKDKDRPREPEFCTMSRRPAIGAHYVHSHINYHRANRKLTVRNDVGQEIALPRYYKEKMFSKDELAELNEEAKEKADLDELKKIVYSDKRGENYFKLKVEYREQKIRTLEQKLNKKNTI